MLFLLQSPQTLWNFALGADILGTILFFFVARNDSYSVLTLFINFLCCISNLLWAKMFTDLQRNQRTIYFFIGLAMLAVLGMVFAWRAPVEESEEDEYDYEYFSDDEGESEPKAIDASKKEKKKLK